MRSKLFLQRAAVLIGFSVLMSVSSLAQNFSSGSTGADGPLDCTNNCIVQLPESGILNYTTVNVPSGKLLEFKRNFRNTPVIILASGNVNIAGHVWLNASGTVPGPGGYFGGSSGQNGFGPGGGSGANPDAKWVGSLSLVPITGGSGGFGVCSAGGGGGGGAIVIASSASIFVSGEILAIGAINCGQGTGSGGAIRLVANAINVNGLLQARACSGCSVSPGVIRLEAPAGSLTYTGSASPLPTLSTTINPKIVSDSTTPSLTISSVGGFPVSYTGGRPDSVDLVLPLQATDPINVIIQAHNIPLGTQVNLNISGPSNGTFTPGTLSGTQASSSTTIPASGLSRTGATYILAFADFTLSASAQNFNRKGPNEIAKVRITAKPGAESKLVFMRKNGTEIELAKVPKAIQQQLGLD